MSEKCFVQTKNSSNRSLFSVVEKDFIFNWAILKKFVNFARKVLVVGGKREKSRDL